jgi:hypothetical protein
VDKQKDQRYIPGFHSTSNWFSYQLWTVALIAWIAYFAFLSHILSSHSYSCSLLHSEDGGIIWEMDKWYGAHFDVVNLPCHRGDG